MKNKHKKRLINDKIYLLNAKSLDEFRGLKLSRFRRRVLKAICSIPLGQTRSYQWVAGRAGSPRAYRAVGRVLNKNPFAPLVPCHRVIRSCGDIGGYSKGEKTKKILLEVEERIANLIRRKKC